MKWLVLLLILLLGATGCGEDAVEQGSALYERVKGWSCSDVGGEAVRISETNGQGAKLLSVEEAVPLQDNRVPGMELPTGATDQLLLLRCQGTASWADSTRSPVDLRWTVDATGDEYVYYQSVDGR